MVRGRRTLAVRRADSSEQQQGEGRGKGRIDPFNPPLCPLITHFQLISALHSCVLWLCRYRIVSYRCVALGVDRVPAQPSFPSPSLSRRSNTVLVDTRQVRTHTTHRRENMYTHTYTRRGRGSTRCRRTPLCCSLLSYTSPHRPRRRLEH